MDNKEILETLKELTQDFVDGKRNRSETVIELNKRIDPDIVYKMDSQDPQRDFITEVFVSLDNLATPDFAPSMAEMQYFTDCFAGRRTFSREEVRRFPIGPFEKENR